MLFLLHGRYELPCQAKLPEFHCTPILGCIRVLWFVFQPLGLRLDKALCGRNSVTDQPDYSFLPDQDFDWTNSVYGNVQEILPDDMPDPLGEAVITTTTMDANLNHCLATGKSLTGCLHFVNKTPVNWYSKKQATVETATYGSTWTFFC